MVILKPVLPVKRQGKTQRGRFSFSYLKIVLFCLVVAIVLIGQFSSIGEMLSFESLIKNHEGLLLYSQSHKLQTAIVFIFFFTLIIGFMIPGASILTLSAGVLFSQPYATLFTAFASSMGACIAFLLAQTTVGSSLKEQAQKFRLMKYLKRHLEGESRVALLISITMLRIVPFLPFWFVNVVPVLFGVNLKEFALSTLVGILPGTYVATQAGVILNDELLRASHSDAHSMKDLWKFLMNALFAKKMHLPLATLSLWVVTLLAIRICAIKRIETWFGIKKSWVQQNDKYFR